MKYLGFLVIAIIFSAASCEELYSDKYDNLNVDEALANTEVRETYFNCFMDKGPCGEDATYWKSKILFLIQLQIIAFFISVYLFEINIQIFGNSNFLFFYFSNC